MSLDINPEFEKAIDAMEKTDNHFFVTGKAGAGKSTLLSHYCQTSKKEIVVLAPTGVAALNVNGQTIHSFFNFYIDVTVEKIINKEVAPYSKRLYRQLKTIIIDEISMVRADLMDCIDVFLRMYGPYQDEPFGGVQMIFFGDLYQLPPVVPKLEQAIFETHYDTPYFFSAHVFKQIDFETITLTKIYRQQDQVFINLLDHVRHNEVTYQHLNLLNKRFIRSMPSKLGQSNDLFIHLTTTNRKADDINQWHLAQLEGQLLESKAAIKGDFTKEYYPTLDRLSLKIGAQIMLVNNDTNKRWHNGTIGIIEAVVKRRNKKGLLVKLEESGEQVVVHPFKWEVYRFTLEDNKIVANPVGTFTQFPVRLAWAITIHKSQGKTFDKVIIDLGRGTFVPGQLYVALSRCRTFEGIYLKQPIQPRHIETDPRIAAI